MSTSFRGKDLTISFNAVQIEGDGRTVSFDESAETHDDTKYGASARTRIAGLTDGSGSFEALDASGDWSAAWEAIVPGTSATMVIMPEGAGSLKRTLTFTAIITARSVTWPYDDLAEVSMSYEISGAVVPTTQA